MTHLICPKHLPPETWKKPPTRNHAVLFTSQDIQIKCRRKSLMSNRMYTVGTDSISYIKTVCLCMNVSWVLCDAQTDFRQKKSYEESSDSGNYINQNIHVAAELFRHKLHCPHICAWQWNRTVTHLRAAIRPKAFPIAKQINCNVGEWGGAQTHTHTNHTYGSECVKRRIKDPMWVAICWTAHNIYLTHRHILYEALNEKLSFTSFVIKFDRTFAFRIVRHLAAV